ncbi:acid phosphatase/Vanadium-dependent haloperoxidase [Canariomyces notabilis]|uniref:Acid phosphatase/Vanadium-dependent haloperoxidase n=1 Tax=Canariomyces notabilis TaxID=2074819 RepID=A0AAN6YWM8_9PEZI|nr:acid phosphatase/Vanadium-dependent haloperoxidase [Canariomyces arenarius]
MRLPLIVTATAAAVANAAYPGDIVYYWVDQSASFVNGTVIGGLQSPVGAWYQAILQAAVYQAAVKSRRESLEFQQLAVSHAAHNAILWVFHGTRLYNSVDAALRAVIPAIGLDPSSSKGTDAVRTGQNAAAKVAEARADDKITNFVDFTYGPQNPGVYQQTPGSNPLPDVPQARFITPFAALGDITRFRAPPPPPTNSEEFEAEVRYVKEQGSLNSTVRTQYDTDTAYFWRESSITAWNRFAGAIIGNKLATNVPASAKFYAQLNYALANAGFAAWDTKYHYQVWRPQTAIQYPSPWVHSGRNDIYHPSWTPLLRPTPSHPDYVSTHATFGGAATAVLRVAFNNNNDTIERTTWSSNVTIDNRGVITRAYTSLREAAEENAQSRVFGGIHFAFAGVEGIALGERVAKETLRKFDDNWDKF